MQWASTNGLEKQAQDLAARILPQAARALKEMGADYVLVHGDTLTTFAVAWAAFLEGIPVGHVEAGLRSGNLKEPFPEEANRRLTDVLTDLDFAPTPLAKANLLKEGKREEGILVTGQTGVDAVLLAVLQTGNALDGLRKRVAKLEGFAAGEAAESEANAPAGPLRLLGGDGDPAGDTP